MFSAFTVDFDTDDRRNGLAGCDCWRSAVRAEPEQRGGTPDRWRQHYCATLEVCRELNETYGTRVRIIKQTLPFLGGAFRSGVAAATGSQILLMFADLESDPHVVPSMVSAAEAEPGSIISASRWLRGANFVHYGHMKLVLNYCFQRLCAMICNCELTDFTYGFRLYPSSILKNTEWHETDHAFVLEAILKPLFDHVPVREVPAVWSRRKEGERRSRFRQYLHYIPTLLKIVIAYPRRQRLEGEELVTHATRKRHFSECCRK